MLGPMRPFEAAQAPLGKLIEDIGSFMSATVNIPGKPKGHGSCTRHVVSPIV